MMMKGLDSIRYSIAMVLQHVSSEGLERDEGQTLVEYALILLLVATVVVGALTFLAGDLKSAFSSIGSSL